MIIRALSAAICAAIIFFMMAVDFGPSVISAACGAAIAWAAVTWRTRPIVKAAKELAHAFCLTDKPCIDETRALSRAVFLGGK